MDKKRSEAYILSLEFLRKAEEEGIVQSRTKLGKNGLRYNVYKEGKVVSTRGKFAYVNTEIFEGLSQKGIIMVCKIMAELKHNNTLWHFDLRLNKKDYAVIKELREKQILFKVGSVNIHYVNPFYIRAGMIVNIILRMIELLETSSAVTTDHLKKLAWEGEITVSGIDLIGLTK